MGGVGAYTCVRRAHTLGECVALAWEPDAEHVLDRVYRVTDLRAHHNASSPSPCPPPARPSSTGAPRRGPRARARPLCSLFERNPVARTHASGSNTGQTMRDLARSPFFATIVCAVLITRDAQHTSEINFCCGGG